jgi:hypothetical protein
MEIHLKTSLDAAFQFKTTPVKGSGTAGQRKNYQTETMTNLDVIITPRHRTLLKSLPQLCNDDSGYPTQFLPFKVFNDSARERYSLPYLLQHPKAWSKYTDVGMGTSAWQKCNVLEYRPKTAPFLIEWGSHK